MAIGRAIAHALATDGVVPTWDGLLLPVLADIGERHAATGGLVEVEHLMSRCVSEAFATVARAHPAAGPARILLACADEEQHTLPLEALAAALPLARAGAPTLAPAARTRYERTFHPDVVTKRLIDIYADLSNAARR
ncbi:hypothetical protein GCM10027452_28930 [Micromonospora halotolerans]